MQVVPLSPLPAQTAQIVLAGQSVALSIYMKQGSDFTDPTLQTPAPCMFADITSNGVVLTTAALVLSQKRLLRNRRYLGFVGDFMVVDTQGKADPLYTGLGSRWVLLYLEASDIPNG